MRLQRLLAGVLVIFLLAGVLTANAAPTAYSEELVQTIIDSCTYENKVDISQYELNRQELEDLFYELLDSGKLPWYTDNTYTCYYDQDTNLVLEFEPDSLDEATYNRALYEQMIAQALAECVFEGMTPVQIALSLHDWLAANTVYDETLEKNTAYDLLVNGTTVCAGYADAYRDLMNRAGIECITVTSEKMEHAWNLVNIDGQWYHVDVTWDDPTPDSYGFVDHSYFLLTDQEISSGDDPHYDWETDIRCTDTRFSDGYWRDITSRICFTDSAFSYFLRSEDWTNYLIRRDASAGTETILFTDEQDYINIGHGEYTYTHGSLSLWNGRLYVSTMNALVSVAPNGEQLRSEYSHSTVSNYLYTGFVSKDTLFATLADHDGNKTSTQIRLADSGYHAHSYVETVNAPTCLEPGHTVSACECGITFQSKLLPPAGHSYQSVGHKSASFFSGGFSNEKCDVCGDETTVYTPRIDVIDWLKEHSGTLLGILVFLLIVGPKIGKKKAHAR